MEAGLIVLLFGFIGLAGLVFWIWALVDAIRTPDDRFQTGNQLLWIVVIALTNVVGALIYLILGRPRSSSPGALS